jgi:Na+/H+ antiporter NhaC
MEHSFLVLLPPLVVLIVGCVSRKVLLSLFCGIITAGFIASDFHPINTAFYIGENLWKNFELYNLVSFNSFFECKNLFICIFLFELGAIIAMVGYSGGAYAYGNFMQKRLTNKTSTQTASLILSLFLFVDDYFSSLTAGNVMTPLTDRYKIPRAKLAFLVDSMAAPLAILCPFSSWFAAIIGFLSDNGISSEISSATLILASPFSIYLYSVPFIIYSFLIILGSFYIIRRKISFGLMKKHEEIAEQTGNLFGGNLDYQKKMAEDKSVPTEIVKNASLYDFFIPISVFVISIVAGMVLSGGYHPFRESVSFFEAMQNSSVAFALFIGGSLSFFIITSYFIMRRKISLRSFKSLVFKSSKMMFQTMMILMLAWTLGDVLRTDLPIGKYIADLVAGTVQVTLLPMLFFLFSLLIAFATGTSWGTAAVMLPIAIPTTIGLLGVSTPASVEQVSLLFPVIGAVLSGCVAGDHISPISDTTIMSSSSTKMPHIDHVQTQMGYALPLIATTAIGFLVLGITIPYGYLFSISIAGLISVALAFLVLEQFNRFSKTFSFDERQLKQYRDDN